MSKMNVLILCGGLGTRFRSISKKIPKALAIVSNKPILDWLLMILKKQGFNKVILATGFKGELIDNHIKNHWKNSCIISKENEPLGTGGAIKNAFKYISSEKILILNGDTLINYNFSNLIDFHEGYNAEISILLSSITNGLDYGNILIDKNNNIIDFKEKGNVKKNMFVNSGVYCVNTRLIFDFPNKKSFSFEKDILEKWTLIKKIKGKVVKENFIDIGTPERFNNANFKL